MTAPFTNPVEPKRSGRTDALRPPTGGPGRPAPSFTQFQRPQAPQQRPQAPRSGLIGGVQRAAKRAITRPTQSTISPPPRSLVGGVQNVAGRLANQTAQPPAQQQPPVRPVGTPAELPGDVGQPFTGGPGAARPQGPQQPKIPVGGAPAGASIRRDGAVIDAQGQTLGSMVNGQFQAAGGAQPGVTGQPAGGGPVSPPAQQQPFSGGPDPRAERAKQQQEAHRQQLISEGKLTEGAGVVSRPGAPQPISQAPPQISGGAGPSLAPQAFQPPAGGGVQFAGGGAGPPPLVNAAQPGGPGLAPPPGGPPPPQFGGNPLTPDAPDAVPLSGLGGLLERQLANPSRFGSEEFQRAFGSFQEGSKADEEEAANRARALASSRGVFFGSGGIREEERSRRPFQRGRADVANALLLNQAQTGGQDLQSAIGNAFRFGENITSADQFSATLGSNLLGQGLTGAPDINAASANIAAQPLPGAPPPLDLGGLAGLGGQGGGGGAPPPGPSVTGAIGDAISGINFTGGLGGPGGTPTVRPGVDFTGGLTGNRPPPPNPFRFNLRRERGELPF